MNNIEDFPELDKWLDDNVETVQDIVYCHWDVIDVESCSNKLLEMAIENRRLNYKVVNLNKTINIFKRDAICNPTLDY